ncbi:MAG: acetate kinase, partial [Gallionellaceae bacterium]|nr:acetate kinase [Gallionellaceae bacterium]
MKTILTLNSGSSSVKASLFHPDGSRRNFSYEHVRDPREAFDGLMRELSGEKPDIIGHRLVHGGDIADAARLVDAAERARLEGLICLAPLHMPSNLLGLDLCAERFAAPQVACFDTA